MKENLPLEAMLEALRRLDDAAMPRLRAVDSAYHQMQRPARRDEMRWWRLMHGYCAALANACEFVLTAARQQPGQQRRPALAWLSTRLIGVLATQYQWAQLHYGPVTPVLWQRAGHALLLAEELGLANVATPLPGAPSANVEYARLLLLHAASLNALLPREMALAARVVNHLLPGFVLSRQADQGSCYWVDLASSRPPQRLTQPPETSSSGTRFITSAGAQGALSDLMANVARGGPLPAGLWGEKQNGNALLAVLQHLSAQLSPFPQARSATRHPVKHRMSVLHGLPMAWQVFAWRSANFDHAKDGESWIVEDVSSGGLGASLVWRGNDWLKVGALLSMCPEGGNNWLLGCVRRCQRASDGTARLGIEVLGRRVQSVDFLLPNALSGSKAHAGVIPGLLIEDECPDGECCVVLPAGAFNKRESLVCISGQSKIDLTPLALLEQGGGFALARYALVEPKARSTHPAG